jgi:hypothetical protein
MGGSSDLPHYQRHIIRDPKICGGSRSSRELGLRSAPYLPALRPAIHPRLSWLTFPVSLSMTSEPRSHLRLYRLKRIYLRQPFLAFHESEAR